MSLTNEREFRAEELPDFAHFSLDETKTALLAYLKEYKNTYQALLKSKRTPTFSELFGTLEQMEHHIHVLWSPLSHLHAVMYSDALQAVYQELLPALTELHTELMQDVDFYHAVKAIFDDPSFANCEDAQKKIVKNALRDFKLGGVALPEDKKQIFAKLEQELGELSTTFSEHLLKATAAFHYATSDENALAGLPPRALQYAREEALRLKVDGFALTLDYPSYSSAIRYLHDRKLRERLYEAHITRASDQGPNAGKFDNSPVMLAILQKRQALAELLQFPHYADYSLATKMASSESAVMTFLQELLQKCKPLAQKEIEELQAFARSKGGPETLAPWDVPYYSEQLQHERYAFTQETLRPYFPIDKVLSGMFDLVQTLFGITLLQKQDVSVWHPDVRFFAIHDEKGACIAGFYTDLYARPNKRDGAWMDDCRSRMYLQDGTLQRPLAYLTCNMQRGVDGAPALLTHDDVMTLFHEFGHVLHHLLTKVNYSSVSGIHGVLWDAVEFPSQFMEYFCWDYGILQSLTQHVETGETLPKSLFDALSRARHFQTGMITLRQLEFALFDFKLHQKTHFESAKDIQDCLMGVRKETALLKVPDYYRFQHSFSHIFAGGYAAGYYSYLWANVLAADAFETFLHQGLKNPVLGQAFKRAVLEVGGVDEPMDAFVRFQGREPDSDAYLRQSGILVDVE